MPTTICAWKSFIINRDFGCYLHSSKDRELQETSGDGRVDTATYSVHEEKRVVSFISAVRTNSFATCDAKELAKIFSKSKMTSISVT